jgi:hypothetical protein
MIDVVKSSIWQVTFFFMQKDFCGPQERLSWLLATSAVSKKDKKLIL